MILAIDTSGKTLGLALCREDNIVSSRLLKTGLRHGEIIQRTIGEFLDDSDLHLTDLSGIAVTLGPGSFTGLRIGLAAAKGYAYGLDLPLTGISTLFAGSHNFTSIDSKVIVIIDARKDEYYYAEFDCSTEEPSRLTADAAGNITQLTKSVDNNTILFGPSHLQEHFVALNGQSGYYISDDFNLAIPTARWGERKIKQNELLDVSTAVPVYIRAGF